MGWAKLLRKGKLDQKTTDRALETIERNANIQIQLIEDLLDVSKILQGKLILNVSPVDLSTVITNAIDTVRLAANVKSIQIQTHLPPKPIPFAMGDAARLQQVVWNLLSNAVKFTPNYGQIYVALSEIEQAENILAQITVRDTGIGIHTEFLPHVFEYFRQQDSSTTRKFGGLGLGLAIARQIVELHGGTICVDSFGEAQGTTFTVSLPIPSRSPTGLKLSSDFNAPTTVSAPLDGLRILIVDDELDSLELIAFVLQQEGATVTDASSASEALQALAQANYDLLISDIGMPDLDGYQFLHQVRALPPTQGGQIPAIALTAYAGDRDRQLAQQAGFQQHIPKPVQPEQLLQAISCLVGSVGTK